MNIMVFFSQSGTPALGLSPKIRIILVDTGTIIRDNVAMVEVGSGFYKYDFADYNEEEDYAILCDGGTALSTAERYIPMTSSAQSLLNIESKIERLLGLCQENTTIDAHQYDSNGNLISCRIRIYSDSTSVGGPYNVISTYNMLANYNEGKLTSYSVSRRR